MEDAGIGDILPGSTSNNPEAEAAQVLEDICLSDESGSEAVEDGSEAEGDDNDDFTGFEFADETAVNGLEDIWKINFSDLSLEDVMKYHFPDVGVGFMFYNWYAGLHGFAARKSKIMRNKNGETTQQTFLCYRQGHREEKIGSTSRKREPKPQTRCGCEAKCRVHIDVNSGRWYIKHLNDVHNHTLLDAKFMGMLPAHRKMSDYDKFQMNSMRNVGISTPHIFGLFVQQSGGYDMVGFRQRDMYNEVERQRQTHYSDAKAALDFLQGMTSSDEMLFWRHTVDDDGRLENLFWCDGVSRRDFAVFGDVLAFDATYRKIKYMCPLVVFSGVNHHNQSIVFASAIVGNETEGTYVWLLEQLIEAMGGKTPKAVITDGDSAMRSAIKKVLPNCHHRLCAWHLLRNATTHIPNTQFVSKFKRCMLGDYEVHEFERMWDKMVQEFGLQENSWVLEMYEKRKMWATAHIRGNFFAGFRTTSRCEGLHSFFARYVNFQNNLLEFLQHYFRGLSYMRFKEVEADFSSAHGDPVLQTQLQDIEKFAADTYTREIFLIFRPIIQSACKCRIICCRQTASSFVYTVCKYRKEGFEWFVTFYPSSLEFICSCQRLESLGIPCEHLVCLLVNLDIVVIPECLVMRRWSKNAKDSIDITVNVSATRDPALISQYVGIVEHCKKMARAAVCCGRPQYVRNTVEWVTSRTQMLEAVGKGIDVPRPDPVDHFVDGSLRNPARVRTKGCGASSSSAKSKGKRTARKPQTCGICKGEGHNRKSCPLLRQLEYMSQTQVDSNAVNEEQEGENEEGTEECEDSDADTVL